MNKSGGYILNEMISGKTLKIWDSTLPENDKSSQIAESQEKSGHYCLTLDPHEHNPIKETKTNPFSTKGALTEGILCLEEYQIFNPPMVFQNILKDGFKQSDRTQILSSANLLKDDKLSNQNSQSIKVEDREFRKQKIRLLLSRESNLQKEELSDFDMSSEEIPQGEEKSKTIERLIMSLEGESKVQKIHKKEIHLTEKRRKRSKEQRIKEALEKEKAMKEERYRLCFKGIVFANEPDEIILKKRKIEEELSKEQRMKEALEREKAAKEERHRLCFNGIVFANEITPSFISINKSGNNESDRATSWKAKGRVIAI